MGAPQHEHHGLEGGGNAGDQGIGDGFPACAGVRARLCVLHRQDGIEQQHPLACPATQIVAGGNGNGEEAGEVKLDAAGAAAAPVDDEATLAATAKAMGYGAVKYADLKNNRMTNYK